MRGKLGIPLETTQVSGLRKLWEILQFGPVKAGEIYCEILYCQYHFSNLTFS